jgi:hypothetical protein
MKGDIIKLSKEKEVSYGIHSPLYRNQVHFPYFKDEVLGIVNEIIEQGLMRLVAEGYRWVRSIVDKQD